jgi:predicted dehydrogenase
MARSKFSRRDFLVRSAAGAAALTIPKGVFAQGKDQIKVGVIGCGGRGTDACVNALNADPATVIWAMGDLFPERLEGSRTHLEKNFGDRVQAKDRSFLGWDNHKFVCMTEVDYVILTAPPVFRHIHFPHAVEMGKHIFCEKPVATDAPSVRIMHAASDLATEKKLNVVAGTQRRHDPAYRECIQRIQDGQMGEIVACYAYWNQGGLWDIARTPNMSDMEWQIRNWLYFTWTAGDIIVEQHIHNQDVCHWAKGKFPVKAISLAGRQTRTDAKYGHIFDHFATEFEYDDGTKLISMCRQQDGTASRVSERIVGTKGSSDANSIIRGANAWRWEGKRPNPYVEEHKNLIASMRGKQAYINEGRQVTDTTLSSIMGRMAGYTGKEITWEQALNSQESLVPTRWEFGDHPVAEVAMPGRTEFK